MRRVLTVVLAVFWVGFAHAEPAPHVAKFQAFREALEAGDIAAADAAGAEALQLAAANGAAPRTVQTLAVNLAGLRLTYALPDPATPLAQAQALAKNGATAADAETFELLAAWAELQPENRTSRVRLEKALKGGVAVDVAWRWAASQQLMAAAGASQDWPQAIAAADLAEGVAEGSDDPLDFARARMKTAQAAARYMAFLENMAELKAVVASAQAAGRVFVKYARVPEAGRAGRGLIAVGDARALASLARAGLVSARIEAPKANEGEDRQQLVGPGWTACALRYNVKVDYPGRTYQAISYGAATLAVRTDASGDVVETIQLAEAPVGYGFGPAAVKAMPKAKATLAPESTPGCNMAGWAVFTVEFRIF
jgi:hypothetical protein